MDDMKKLIEKYKQELVEYSRAADRQQPQGFPAMPEMLEESESDGFSYYPETAEESEEIPAPAPAPETVPEPETAPEPAPAEERHPQVIGYVGEGNEDILAKYDELFRDMADPKYEEVPSFSETRTEITENSSPKENVPETKPVSGVTDNTTNEPLPNTPQATEGSPEQAERLTEQPVSGTSPDEQLTGRAFEDTTPPQNNPADIKPLENEGTPFKGFEEPEYATYEDFLAKNQSRGTMQFRIYTARGALPVEGAVCRIMKKFGGEQKTLFTLMTDRSGKTPAVALPAPSAAFSQNAQNTIQPFSLYDADITAEGFATVKLVNIPVFDGILSLQRTAMVPTAEGVIGQETIDETAQTRNGGV